MTITVTLSGRLYNLRPARPVEVTLPAEATVQDVLQTLRRDETTRSCLVDSALLAVSGKHIGTVAKHSVVTLSQGDDLLIFAPMAGG